MGAGLQDAIAARTWQGAGLRVGPGSPVSKVPDSPMSPSLLLSHPQDYVVPRTWPRRGAGRGWAVDTGLTSEVVPAQGAQESTGQGASTPDLGCPYSLPGALGKSLHGLRTFSGVGWDQSQQGAPHNHPGFQEALGSGWAARRGVRWWLRPRFEAGEEGEGASAGHSELTPQMPFCRLCFPGVWAVAPGILSPSAGAGAGKAVFF